MKKYSDSAIAKGELAARNLTGKAADFYNSTDYFKIAEYQYNYDENDNPITQYAIIYGGEVEDGLTFEEVQEFFDGCAQEG